MPSSLWLKRRCLKIPDKEEITERRKKSTVLWGKNCFGLQSTLYCASTVYFALTYIIQLHSSSYNFRAESRRDSLQLLPRLFSPPSNSTRSQSKRCAMLVVISPFPWPCPSTTAPHPPQASVSSENQHALFPVSSPILTPWQKSPQTQRMNCQTQNRLSSSLSYLKLLKEKEPENKGQWSGKNRVKLC